jgi:nucleoside-diphosphate-sugar epimerase
VSAVLVTGAAGFIGRHVVRALLADGEVVIGVDNFITSEREDLRPLLEAPRVRFIEADVASPAFPAALAGQRVDAIYHLACPTGVPNLGPLALEMLRTCYEGTSAALSLARAHNAPLLLASSAEVYGNPERAPQDESYSGNVDPLGPRKGYEEGKRVAETLCGIYAERFGVRAVIARIFNTYGPGMSLAETRVVPAFARAALEGRPLLLHGDGAQTRCHLYIDDLVAGLRLALAHGAPGRAYNLGGTTPATVRDLAERIVRLAGSSSPIVTVERPAHDHDNRLPDTGRARTELGWQALVDFETGLAETIADIRTRLAAPSRTTRATQ